MLIRKIKEILKPPPSTGIPLNITAGELERLKELRSSKGWQDYVRLLDRLSTLYGETLLGKSDNAEVHFYRGSILALRRAGTIIDEITRTMEGKDAESRKREHDSTVRRELQQRLATYGTPFWTGGSGAV